MMKLLFAITILILSTISLVAQDGSKDLVLTGTVLDVKPFKFGQQDGRSNEDPRPGDDLYKIELLLQLRNAGDAPVIALPPREFVGKISVIFLEPCESSLDVTSHTVATHKNQAPPRNRQAKKIKGGRSPERDEMDWLVYYLLSPYSTPYGSGFMVIAPGAYYEYRQSLTVRTGYKIRNIEGEGPRAVSDFPALRVNYFLSLKSSKGGADALKVARNRWKNNFGHLPLDDTGDYTITSEVNLNKLNN